jgi:hypothetical protein
VRVEPCTTLVSIDVEGVLCEPENLGANQLAAEGKDEPVVVQKMASASAHARHLSASEVDRDNFTCYPLDPDWIEHTVQRNPHFPQISFIISHSDRVPSVSVDDRYLDLVFPDSELVECARRADSTPQTGKTSTKDKDPRRQRL